MTLAGLAGLAIPLVLMRRQDLRDARPPVPVFKDGLLTAANHTKAPTVVKVSFGAVSAIKSADWKFCTATSPLNCHFTLPANASLVLPTLGLHLNATFSFGSEGCGATKAEFDLNNPVWFDTYDVSLVDGYSNKIAITATPIGDGGAPITLGPPNGKDGNEKVFGLFPYGCDVCVARQSPPCGIPSGGAGCKAGTQYKPDVPCQYQGAVKGGGGAHVVFALEP
jgi:hypothetical protein